MKDSGSSGKYDSEQYDHFPLDAGEAPATENYQAIERNSTRYNSKDPKDADYEKLSSALRNPSSGGITSEAAANPKKRFKGLVQKVMVANSMSTLAEVVQKSKQHRRKTSMAQDMLKELQDDDQDESENDIFAEAHNEDHRMFAHVTDEKEWEQIQQENNNMAESGGIPMEIIQQSEEEIPSLPFFRSSDHGGGYGATTDAETHNLLDNNDDTPVSSSPTSRLMYPNHRHVKLSFYQRMYRLVWLYCCHPQVWGHYLKRAVISSYIPYALPFLISAWILFYYLHNPKLDFLPGEVTVAWWLNFMGRQVLTLELSRITQYIFLDCVVLGTRIGIRMLGPFLTLFAIQARGWPFLLAVWACWDLCILHGNDNFQLHWLYWANIRIYSLVANSGAYIISSETYLRVLLCMLLAGVATACKRLYAAITFGKRQFLGFKPRLARILTDIGLLNDVTALAASIEDYETNNNSGLSSFRKSKGLANVTFHSRHIAASDDDQDDDDDNSSLEEDDDNEDEADGKSARSARSAISKASSNADLLRMSSSGDFRLVDLLDRWQEPVNKLDKSSDVEISDVLKFKRVLSWMDDQYPFGEDYGPASNRNESITSAHSIYTKLLKLTPDEKAVTFDTLELLATEPGGRIDQVKRRGLRKMFRPGKANDISLLNFVQQCDNLYKRVRFFRASVGNASVIDKVLEDVMNVFFFFVLGLLILSLMQYNPWTLLVSLTSVLVSVSFAMGPSVAKYVEGVLLIAVCRPYDLGDRVFIDIVNKDSTMFVEDIDIATTTLRDASTGEVSTISNWSLARTRIVNCNRSPNALVTVKFKFHTEVLGGDNLKKLKKSLETYVADHPRRWETMFYCKVDSIDNDNEVVYFSVVIRHRQSWQEALPILLHRSDLIKFIHATGNRMDIHVDTPPARRIMYTGGAMEHGNVVDYKRNLTRAQNLLQTLTADAPSGIRSFAGGEVGH